MAINKPIPASLIQKREEEAEIRRSPAFEYISRPGDGVARYVFHEKVCLTRKEALAYVRQLVLDEL